MIDRSESRLLQLEQRNRLRAQAKRHLRLARPASGDSQPAANSSAVARSSIRKPTRALSNGTPVQGSPTSDIVG